MPEVEPLFYLIADLERGAWWLPNRAGYTLDLQDAGRYERREALAICANARGGWRPGDRIRDIPVLEIDAIEIERIAPTPINRKDRDA